MSDRFLESPSEAAQTQRSSAANGESGGMTRGAIPSGKDVRPERRGPLEPAHGQFASDSLRAHEILRAVGRRLGAAACELWRTPKDGGLEVLESSWRDGEFATAAPDANENRRTHAQPLPEACDRAEWIVDVATDARVGRDEWLRANGLHALLRAPVRSERASLGSVRVYWRQRRAHDAAAADLVANGAGVLATHLEERPSNLADVPHLPCLGALLRVTSDPTLVTDFNGRIVEANSPAEVLLGRSRDALLGRAFIETAVPERLRPDAAAALVRLVAQPARVGKRERLATCMLLPNDEEQAVSVDAVASHAPDPELVFVSAIPTQACVCGAAEPDPTRTQMRSLMTSLLVAEERERRRLAQDLHDGLSQLIALAQMKLAALSHATGGHASEQHKALDEIQALIVAADRSARSIGCELSPPSLHQLGLVPALRWLVESLHERYGVSIQFTEPEPLPELDETRNVVLFRSVRELLINAAKHAQAASVELSLREAFGRLVVRVRDDGVGMRNDVEQSAGTGLVSMRERLAHIGGALRIKSKRGAGTSVEIELILPVAANQPGSLS